MVSVRLRNPNIILTPITDSEKAECEKRFMGDESVYVLYRLPDSHDIHIGMMSSSMREHFPSLANVWNLSNAISKAYFYNGCSELEANATQITDRPVYVVEPTDDRMVSEYDILNATTENGLGIRLEDIVDGKYTLSDGKPAILKK